MSQYRKLILDHDIADGLKVAFDNCNAHVTVVKSKDILANGTYAKDGEILIEGKTRNAYVVTADNHYRNPKLYPCNSLRYARRTIVEMKQSDMLQIANTLLKAWRKVTWSKVVSHPLLVVQEASATLYECDGERFIPVDTFRLT